MKYPNKVMHCNPPIMRPIGNVTNDRQAVCRGIILSIMFSAALSLSGKEAPELHLKLLRPLAHGFTYSEYQNGWLYAAPCESREGQRVGLMLIWKPGEGGDLVDITTLSSLDQVLRSQIARLGAQADKHSILRVISAALGEYVQLQSSGVIMFPSERERYLQELKPHVSDSTYQRIKERLIYPPGNVANDSWTLSYIVRKADGGIELNRFSGTLTPFSIVKREIEVIAGVGTIPHFDYVRQTPDGAH